MRPVLRDFNFVPDRKEGTAMSNTLPANTALDHDGADVTALARQTAQQLAALSADPSAVVEIESLGRDAQEDATRKSAMLRQPIKSLAAAADDGGPVAKGLVELKEQVEALDPAKFDFEAGWLSRTLGLLPIIGSPIKRYFTQFESAQTVIDAIVNSLKLSQEQLKRDNITIADDRDGMRSATKVLDKRITFAKALDTALVAETAGADEAKKRFVEEQLLFKLRQRQLDLGQQMAVNQQGVLALDVIIENNKELISGVDRAVNVTVRALEVAVTVALALANQKIALTKIDALNKTTSDMIAGTAERLKTQGAAIQKQASNASLDIKALERAFRDILIAIEDVSNYRRAALPKMAEQILAFDRLADAGEAAIKRLEQGRAAAPTVEQN
jgi:uncharacterized protein YaaN involved in tellurite resistance